MPIGVLELCMHAFVQYLYCKSCTSSTPWLQSSYLFLAFSLSIDVHCLMLLFLLILQASWTFDVFCRAVYSVAANMLSREELIQKPYLEACFQAQSCDANTAFSWFCLSTVNYEIISIFAALFCGLAFTCLRFAKQVLAVVPLNL